MADTETKLNAEFDAWFAKVCELAGRPLEPDESWAELWFDGYTPEEALLPEDAHETDPTR